MRPAQSTTHQKLLELLRLTPEPNMREGYVMVFQSAVDEYVRTILHDDAAGGESSSC